MFFLRAKFMIFPIHLNLILKIRFPIKSICSIELNSTIFDLKAFSPSPFYIPDTQSRIQCHRDWITALIEAIYVHVLWFKTNSCHLEDIFYLHKHHYEFFSMRFRVATKGWADCEKEFATFANIIVMKQVLKHPHFRMTKFYKINFPIQSAIICCIK